MGVGGFLDSQYYGLPGLQTPSPPGADAARALCRTRRRFRWGLCRGASHAPLRVPGRIAVDRRNAGASPQRNRVGTVASLRCVVCRAESVTGVRGCCSGQYSRTSVLYQARGGKSEPALAGLEGHQRRAWGAMIGGKAGRLDFLRLFVNDQFPFALQIPRMVAGDGQLEFFECDRGGLFVDQTEGHGDTVNNGFRARWAAGDVVVDGNDFFHRSNDGITVEPYAAAAGAGANGEDELGRGHG